MFWAHNNGMTINTNKTKELIICFNKRVNAENIPPLCINGNNIERVNTFVTFGRLAVSDSELGVDVIDFDECYCYLFTVLYCSLVLYAGPF